MPRIFLIKTSYSSAGASIAGGAGSSTGAISGSDSSANTTVTFKAVIASNIANKLFISSPKIILNINIKNNTETLIYTHFSACAI